MVVVIRGRQFYLWRAVDSEGEVLDFLVQSRRNARAAIRLMRKLLKKQGFAPATIVTDNSPLKKALLTGFHSTAKHNATKAVSPSSETMRTI